MGESAYFWKFKAYAMRYSGTYTAKVDAKGRVFFPSEFRRALPEEGAGMVLRRDVFQPCLSVYTAAAWEAEVESLRSRLSRWNGREAMIFRQFMADAVQFSLDANGRFILPRRFMDECGIEHEVCFIGVDDRVEIWGAEQRSARFLSDDELAAALGAL